MNRFTMIALQSIENHDLVYRDAVRQIREGAGPVELGRWWENFYMDHAPYPLGALADEATRHIDWQQIHEHLRGRIA
jgi:hypothetical protein